MNGLLETINKGHCPLFFYYFLYIKFLIKTKYNKREVVQMFQVSDEELEVFYLKNDYRFYRKYQFSEYFMDKYAEKLNWDEIGEHQTLTEEQIEKYANRFDWDNISCTQQMSEKFIEKHKKRINWEFVSKHQILTESFIEKHKDKIDWYWISSSQILSEIFIYNNLDKVNWENISRFQKLSHTFIVKNINNISVSHLKYNELVDWQELKEKGFDVALRLMGENIDDIHKWNGI
jgi:hypothetical protein